MNDAAAALAAEHARLEREIAAGGQRLRGELQQASHQLNAPLRALEHRGEQLRHFARNYSLLLLPLALVVALNPRGSMRVASRAWAAWSSWTRHPGPADARALGLLATLFGR